MSGATIIFYLLAAMAVVNALLSVTTRHIFRAAIYLLFSLIGVAGLYFWLNYEFIAAVQIVVYVGGITVLIIFSIFLTQQAGEKLPCPALSNRLLYGMATMLAMVFTMIQVCRHGFTIAGPGASPDVAAIGSEILKISGYALPFEVVSILLLAALIGCIVIALRKPIKA